ncbi:unnamed protein product, partial [Amoebophrya sp. A120]|eukprot:GSA120T00005769001.1
MKTLAVVWSPFVLGPSFFLSFLRFITQSVPPVLADDFVDLLARNAVPSHNPEHSCERRITDWPNLKSMLSDYAHGRLLFLQDEQQSSIAQWRLQKEIFLHNPDLDFCPIGLLSFFLADAHIRTQHGGEGDSLWLQGDETGAAQDHQQLSTPTALEDGGAANQIASRDLEGDQANSGDGQSGRSNSTPTLLPAAFWKLLETLSYYEDLFWHRLDLSMVLWSGWPSFTLLRRIRVDVGQALLDKLTAVQLVPWPQPGDGSTPSSTVNLLAATLDKVAAAFCEQQFEVETEMNVVLHHLQTLFSGPVQAD